MSDEYIEIITNAENEIEEMKHLAEPGYRTVFFIVTVIALIVGFCILWTS